MANQKSPTSNDIPAEWQPKYIMKRINNSDIELTQSQRDQIIQAMREGRMFVQLGEYTLMINNISAIDPRYPPSNIPPQPPEFIEKQHKVLLQSGEQRYRIERIKNAQYELWQKLFANTLAVKKKII